MNGRSDDALARIAERLGRVIVELEGLRQDLRCLGVLDPSNTHALEDTAAPPTDTDTPTDLCDQHLVDTATVAERFNVPADLARRWCRDEGCGVKRGGRWLASVPRFRRRLNGE